MVVFLKNTHRGKQQELPIALCAFLMLGLLEATCKRAYHVLLKQVALFSGPSNDLMGSGRIAQGLGCDSMKQASFCCSNDLMGASGGGGGLGLGGKGPPVSLGN